MKTNKSIKIEEQLLNNVNERLVGTGKNFTDYVVDLIYADIAGSKNKQINSEPQDLSKIFLKLDSFDKQVSETNSLVASLDNTLKAIHDEIDTANVKHQVTTENLIKVANILAKLGK